jgi:hypothetical protein
MDLASHWRYLDEQVESLANDGVLILKILRMASGNE